LLRDRGWAIGLTNVAITLIACFVAGLFGLMAAKLIVAE
jgi:hypothetical protein